MKLIPLLSIPLLVGFAFDVVRAQSISEPEGDYLHEVSQLWADKTEFGNLRSRALDDQDIEVHLWAGFGVRGSSGVFLRRQGDQWDSSIVDLYSYSAGATEAIARAEGLLSPCVVETMAKRCVIDVTTSDGRPYEYHLDCPFARSPNRKITQVEYVDLWRKLQEFGLLSLPPDVERDWIMMDGHSYVIEVRTASEYRVTVIEHANESDVDQQVHKIVSEIDLILGSWLYGGDK